jgi:hypothetical protein
MTKDCGSKLDASIARQTAQISCYHHSRTYHDGYQTRSRITIGYRQKECDALASRNETQRVRMTFKVDDLEMVTEAIQRLGKPPDCFRYVLGQRIWQACYNVLSSLQAGL